MLALQAKVHISFICLKERKTWPSRRIVTTTTMKKKRKLREVLFTNGTERREKKKTEKFSNKLTLIFSSWENMGTMPERMFSFRTLCGFSDALDTSNKIDGEISMHIGSEKDCLIRYLSMSSSSTCRVKMYEVEIRRNKTQVKGRKRKNGEKKKC